MNISEFIDKRYRLFYNKNKRYRLFIGEVAILGRSVPRRSNETKQTGQGVIKEYKLPPEDLAKIVGKPIPKSHSKPLGFKTRR
ncbi:hypothetical protein ACE41H_15255 [Paenibacillus enshidis]|uniref:Uncharacterized protein n=1 Tax=Paenibacillus enshidis TaxID=1458439 RepID=A0ABV5AV81_9BACL